MKTPGYFSESEMAQLLKLKEITLRARRSRGTDHPPYIRVARGYVLYPEKEYLIWLDSRQLVSEVRRSAS